MCECDMDIYLKYMEELRSPRVSLADVAGETRVLRVQNAEFFEVILHWGAARPARAGRPDCRVRVRREGLTA